MIFQRQKELVDRNWTGLSFIRRENRFGCNSKILSIIELLLWLWNVPESQRLRFMDVALTGAPLTQAEQQRPTEVPENLPAMQSPIRGWEGQENVIDNGSTAYCGVATLSPMDTSGTVRSSVSPNILDLAVNRYVFDHPVFEVDKGEEVDVRNNDDDDSDDDFVDDENKEIVQPKRLTPEQERDNQAPRVELRRSNGVPLERIENISQSVIKSLFKSSSKCSSLCIFLII